MRALVLVLLVLGFVVATAGVAEAWHKSSSGSTKSSGSSNCAYWQNCTTSKSSCTWNAKRERWVCR